MKRHWLPLIPVSHKYSRNLVSDHSIGEKYLMRIPRCSTLSYELTSWIRYLLIKSKYDMKV